MIDKLNVYGFKGNMEELKQLLAAGLHITEIKQSGSAYTIKFETEPKVGRPQKISKEQILQLRGQGMAYAAIAKEVGCTKAYVIKVCQQTASETEKVTFEPKVTEQQELPAPLPGIQDEPEIPGQMKVEDYLPAEPKIKTWKELRQAAGLSQKALAEATGLKLSRIQELERGHRTSIGPVKAHVLARALHCRPEDLPVTIDEY